MKLFIFSFLSQSRTGIYTVIAEDESAARGLLKQDGHSLAENKGFYDLEISFNLAQDENKKSIPYTLEVENESYEG